MPLGLAIAFALSIALFWSLPTTAYCWEGAYNVSQGEPPDWRLVAILVVMGFVPWIFAAAYLVAMRRRGSAASTITFGTLVLAVVTLPVLIVRTLMAAPFF